MYSEVVLTGKSLKDHDSQLRKGPPLRNTIISVLFKFTVIFVNRQNSAIVSNRLCSLIRVSAQFAKYRQSRS